MQSSISSVQDSNPNSASPTRESNYYITMLGNLRIMSKVCDNKLVASR